MSAHALERAPREPCVHRDMLTPCMLRREFPCGELSLRISPAWVKGPKHVPVEIYSR